MTNFNGTTAVVTGAGSGIGRETALLCARRGARLGLCDIGLEGLEETAERARSLGAEVVIQRVDVSDAQAVSEFAAVVHEALGDVELLVNNAGIGIVAGFLDTELEDWERLLSINVMGVVHGCRAFVPAMVARRRGHVINVSSQAGFQANPALVAYSASKFAVFGFSEALRADLAPHGIGVTAVCPGVINTAITRTGVVRGHDAAARQQKLQALYAKRNYGPEKVAEAILRAAARDSAVAPVAPEAHLAYTLSRVVPPVSRWMSAKMAALATKA